jgi:hypothetical protein
VTFRRASASAVLHRRRLTLGPAPRPGRDQRRDFLLICVTALTLPPCRGRPLCSTTMEARHVYTKDVETHVHNDDPQSAVGISTAWLIFYALALLIVLVTNFY